MKWLAGIERHVAGTDVGRARDLESGRLLLAASMFGGPVAIVRPNRLSFVKFTEADSPRNTGKYVQEPPRHRIHRDTDPAQHVAERANPLSHAGHSACGE